MGKGSGSCARPALAVGSSGSGIAGLSEGDEQILSEAAVEFSALERLAVLEQMRARDWREPEELDRIMADKTAEMLGISTITALRLEKEDFDGIDYDGYRRYLCPTRADIRGGEETVIGMQSAAQSVLAHIDAGETIAIFGDYDVDGNTSGHIARDAVESLGGRVHLEYASAADGFGLNHAVVDRAADAGATVLITSDCGSSQSEAIAYAQSRGMEVIVLDHHDVDMDNPAEYHLNPRYDQGLHHAAGADLLARATKNNRQISSAKTAVKKKPDDETKRERLEELLTEQETLMAEMIDFCPASPYEIDNYNEARHRLKKRLDTMMDDEMGTGAQLTWKFGAELQRARYGKIPDEWYGQPLYLAGLGAMADRADMRDTENRAFSRVSLDERGIDAVPIGVRMLAEHFEEDPLRPSKMMRTKATLNLAKRTSRVNADRVAELYRAQSPAEAAPALAILVDEHARSSTARDEMELAAQEYIGDWRRMRRKKKKSSKHRFWVHAVVNDPQYEDYVGQSGIIADHLAKEHGLPAVVFTRQGTDAEGEPILKWSSRNGQVRTKIGGLLSGQWKSQLLVACQVAQSTDDGVVMRGSVGGHEDVVSGSCRASQVNEVVMILNAFANESDRERWLPKNSDRLFVSARRVPGSILETLDREAADIEPATNDNYPTRVSVVGRFSDVGPVDIDRKSASATLTVDGVERRVNIAAATLPAVGDEPMEVVVHPGEDEYYVKYLKELDVE